MHCSYAGTCHQPDGMVCRVPPAVRYAAPQTLAGTFRRHTLTPSNERRQISAESGLLQGRWTRRRSVSRSCKLRCWSLSYARHPSGGRGRHRLEGVQGQASCWLPEKGCASRQGQPGRCNWADGSRSWTLGTLNTAARTGMLVGSTSTDVHTGPNLLPSGRHI